jgi:uncharacterized protein YyaL (SSP411 family)
MRSQALMVFMSKNKKPNRLIDSKSPYLLQHAYNPVMWYPWGPDAFKAAKEQDKPIFLSIGYSTCHWCHVMEEESFENPEIAHALNQVFINIKVDREELPEVDSLYMEFAQSMMAGAAGWPLNVVLTPDLKPFFATTYVPPQTNHGMLGLNELIDRVDEIWNGPEREKIESQASKVVEVFEDSIHVKGEKVSSKALIEDAVSLLFKMADPIYGGIKGVPKFPLGYHINFFLRYAATCKDTRALFLAEKTLDWMQRGGIWDHLAGGFSRYSTDEKWMIPHFEKMLYDNALLIESYVEGWRATKNPRWKEVADSTMGYIFEEMTHPEGGFYSAQDADSDGVEGLYYTWSKNEIKEVFGAKESKDFCQLFDISSKGNFEGRNVLHTELTLKEFALEHGMDLQKLSHKIQNQKKALLKERKKRNLPRKDDKILSSWNGLMIGAIALAGACFDNPAYIEAAKRAALFVKKYLYKDRILLRRFRDGEAMFVAGLDEYAFLIRGLITLFETTGEEEWLRWALELTAVLKENFKEEGGAFYQTDGSDPNLLLRRCQFSDGAEPSGNSVHTENLLRLYQLTGQEDHLDQAEDVFKAVNRMIETYAPGYVFHLMNLLRYYDTKRSSVVLALNKNKDFEREVYKKIYTTHVPHRTVFFLSDNESNLLDKIPLVRGKTCLNGKTTLYLCQDRRCLAPITDGKEMLDALE